MFDDVLLHRFCFVFAFYLVSLHGDQQVYSIAPVAQRYLVTL